MWKNNSGKTFGKIEKITLCFELVFENLDFGEKTLTLKKLLLECSYPDLGNNKPLCSKIFSWVINNQDKVAIIIDGFDQSALNLDPKVPSHGYETLQRIEDLISNLCMKKYLPGVHLIITSRPYNVMTMPYELRPKLTLFVKDLSFDDMKKLFLVFAQERARQLWNQISEEAPHLRTLCLNPMMLQCCVQVFLHLFPSNEQMLALNKWTQVLDSVIKNIKRLRNVQNVDIGSITKQLAVVAFNATMKSTVAITVEQLERNGLTVEQVQDMIVAVQGLEYDTKLMKNEYINLYFFLHLYHMIEELSSTQFSNVLQSQFFLSQKSLIKKFVSGFLFEMQPKGKNGVVTGNANVVLLSS